MPSKKRVHLQQFGIIHLPNTDLTYIRNPERNKISPSTFWKLTSGFLLYSLFFLPSHLEGNADGNTIRAHICAWGGEFCQVSIFDKLVCQTIGGNFSRFTKIRWMSS
jgi:hypothetical protein